MKPGYNAKPGTELRGFQVRLYPTRDQVLWLEAQQHALRRVWNWLVGQSASCDEAVQSYAVKQGRVGPRPVRPEYAGMLPDEAASACAAHRDAVRDWYRAVREATKDDPVCARRTLRDWMTHFGVKQDYQMLLIVLGWDVVEGDVQRLRPSAHMLQALVKNFYAKNGSGRPKKRKRLASEMPVQVRSGDCFELGEFGSRGQNPSFYNCRVSIGGFKVLGRLPGRQPGGRTIQGAAFVREADGWYASVRVESPTRALPDAVPGSVAGIDVGLDNIAALSCGEDPLVINARGRAFVKEIAELQRRVTTSNDDGEIALLTRKSARLHQRMRRHVRHEIYNKVLKPLAHTETIAIEDLDSGIGQMGSSKMSTIRLVRSLLVERYGDRVREVDPAYTSQDCSNCGHRSKESWSYDNGPIGTCPVCNYRAHRDINAARNIAAKVLRQQQKAA